MGFSMERLHLPVQHLAATHFAPCQTVNRDPWHTENSGSTEVNELVNTGFLQVISPQNSSSSGIVN